MPKIDENIVEFHGRKFAHVLTSFGWTVVRDDGQAFGTLAEAIASVKPKEAAPVETPTEASV